MWASCLRLIYNNPSVNVIWRSSESGIIRTTISIFLHDIYILFVFYDVTDEAVEILAIVPKLEAETWLAQQGELDEGRSPSRNSE